MDLGDGILAVAGKVIALGVGLPLLVMICVVTFKAWRQAQADMAQAARASRHGDTPADNVQDAAAPCEPTSEG